MIPKYNKQYSFIFLLGIQDTINYVVWNKV